MSELSVAETKATHTPGPWGAARTKTGFHVGTSGLEGGGTSFRVLPRDKEGDDAQFVQDVRLIRGAPDMESALANLVHWAQEFMADYSAGPPSELGDACQFAHKVLENVRGVAS